MTADEAERHGRRRDLARNGLLNPEWRRGEGVIYRTKLGRRLLPPRGDAARDSRAGERAKPKAGLSPQNA